VKGSKIEKTTCLLIRGKPCSGKSTLATNLVSKQHKFNVLDPDLVDTKSKAYSEFTPRQTKNPSENVKMYCFLYDKAETLLKNNSSVVWTQPWSRIAELELTIRNFGYYLTGLGGKVWSTKIKNIVHRLPFNLFVVEVEVKNSVSSERWIQNNSSDTNQLKRLNKTQKLFQKFSLDVPFLRISGTESSSKNVQTVLSFLNRN
jgi:adenylate kinase family enzyme